MEVNRDLYLFSEVTWKLLFSHIGDFEMALLVPELARLIKVGDVIRWESGRGSRIRGERNRQTEMVNCCSCCDRNGWIVKNALIKISNARGTHFCFNLVKRAWTRSDFIFWKKMSAIKTEVSMPGVGRWRLEDRIIFWRRKKIWENIGEVSPYQSIDWWLIFNYLRTEINLILFIIWRGEDGLIYFGNWRSSSNCRFLVRKWCVRSSSPWDIMPEA